MLVLVVLKQIAIMALLVAVGVCLSKKGYLTVQGSKDLGAILLWAVIPSVVIKSYLVEFSKQRLMDLLHSTGLTLLGLAVSMAIAYLLFGKRRRIENFAASFCNAGFIGIPLVQAVIGEEGVFYIAAAIAFLGLFQWTYGVYIMTGKKEAISLRTIARNPVLIAIVIGILIFVIQIPIPAILEKTLEYVASLNTPVAMMLMGNYMSKLSFRDMLNKRAYSCVFARLILIPCVVLAAYYLLPIHNQAIAMATYLVAITPVGANICIFAQQYDCDYEFSVVTVCLSTVLSVITIPVLTWAARMVL